MKLKKSLSESLCDKRFLCLLVAIIVIIVTSCGSFVPFLHISQLGQKKPPFGYVSKSKIIVNSTNLNVF